MSYYCVNLEAGRDKRSLRTVHVKSMPQVVQHLFKVAENGLYAVGESFVCYLIPCIYFCCRSILFNNFL